MAFDKKKNLDKDIIRILRAVPEGERGTEISIVRYRDDNTSYAPQLVNQEVYTDRLDRARKYGKVKALKFADYKFLTETPERIEEIRALLLDSPFEKSKNKPSGQDAAANDHVRPERPPSNFDDEEVPF